MQEFNNIRTIQLSTLNSFNIGEVKTLACELFTEYKLKADEGSEKANKILSRMHIAIPKKRDNIERNIVNPMDIMDIGPQCKISSKDLQEELGGAGVF